MIAKIAWHSLLNRKGAALLTLVSIVISISLLLGVDQIRKQARESFNRTVSGVDLIVGARTGQTNLLLYSVFRIGNATNNIDWSSYQFLANADGVSWAVPISLGDSHHGFRVLGTTADYFQYYQYGNKQPLEFTAGSGLTQMFDTVIGADVAIELGYQVGDEVVLSHGVGHVSFTQHSHSPFVVSGILAPTGTPVDKTVHVGLMGLKAAHMSASALSEFEQQYKADQTIELPVESVTAVLLGLDSPIKGLFLQRQINQYEGEPLLAILPGVALAELWQLVGNVENILLLITLLILVSSLLGLATMLLASIRERYRELAVLRAIGAQPWFIFVLIQAEALMLSLFGSLLAIGVVWLGLTFSQQWLSQEYGLFIENKILSVDLIYLIVGILMATFLVCCIPAVKAYKTSLQQGLTAR